MHIREAAREGFLYHLWINGSFNRPLLTIDGRPLQILEKGVQNFDAGPDFVNALILLDGQMQRGDIEIHPLAGDWYSHQHHLDPRYNSVILHIVTMHTPKGFIALRQDRTPAATLNLDDFLETPSSELELEDLSLSSSRLPQCSLKEQDSRVQEHVLHHAGLTRMRIKAMRLTEMRSTSDWQQIIYSNLAVSLGYSKNHLPFSRLAQILPAERLWSYVWNDDHAQALSKCEAYLFGAAGLLPLPTAASGLHSDYVQNLLELWQAFPDKSKIEPIKPGSWQFFRLRPDNFPTRRIAGLAELVLRFSQEGFIAPFVKILETYKTQTRACIQEMESRFYVGLHPFWSSRYTFEAPAGGAKTSLSSLLGRDRSREMVVNMLLPALMAYAAEVESHRTLAAVQELYVRYPAMPDNEITRWMKQRLTGPSIRPTHRFSQALFHQGLVHLYKSLCGSDGLCQRCLDEAEPLA